MAGYEYECPHCGSKESFHKTIMFKLSNINKFEENITIVCPVCGRNANLNIKMVYKYCLTAEIKTEKDENVLHWISKSIYAK